MPLKLKNVLVVDDEPGILSAVCRVVERRGINCKSFLTPNKVMPFLNSQSCDLVLLDIVMPGINGLDLMKAIRAKRPDLPIIVMTGHATTADADASSRWGADGFLSKPFTPEDLTREIDRISGMVKPG
jgi:DNA-binding NtrC family response regulator